MSHTLAVSGPAVPVFLGAPVLQPVRLSGHKGLNSLFEYELLLKTPDELNLGASGAADFDLDDFIGREITCSKTVVDILDELLKKYPFAVDTRLIETYPQRDYQSQAGERVMSPMTSVYHADPDALKRSAAFTSQGAL